MSFKERVVFLDSAAFSSTDLPIPAFEHNWSEYPFTDPADLVPRMFWATSVITHAASLDAATVAQLHKLLRIVVTGPAQVDEAACAAKGIRVVRLPADQVSGSELIGLLEGLVADPA